MNITSNNITMIIAFVLAIVFLVSIVPTSSNAVKFDSEKLVAQCHQAISTGHPTSAPCLVIFGAIPSGSGTSNDANSANSVGSGSNAGNAGNGGGSGAGGSGAGAGGSGAGAGGSGAGGGAGGGGGGGGGGA